MHRGVFKVLEVKENKVLKLVNVIKRELRAVPQNEVDRATHKLEYYLKTRKLNSVGPLISATYGANIDEESELGLDIDIMVQIKEKTKVAEPYTFEELVRLTNCIYTRFKGNIEELNYGYTKLELYIWENKLIQKGPIHTVFVDMEDLSNVVVDIFIPVEEE